MFVAFVNTAHFGLVCLLYFDLIDVVISPQPSLRNMLSYTQVSGLRQSTCAAAGDLFKVVLYPLQRHLTRTIPSDDRPQCIQTAGQPNLCAAGICRARLARAELDVASRDSEA